MLKQLVSREYNTHNSLNNVPSPCKLALTRSSIIIRRFLSDHEDIHCIIWILKHWALIMSSICTEKQYLLRGLQELCLLLRGATFTTRKVFTCLSTSLNHIWSTAVLSMMSLVIKSFSILNHRSLTNMHVLFCFVFFH
jgi:hypothetical protein